MSNSVRKTAVEALNSVCFTKEAMNPGVIPGALAGIPGGAALGGIGGGLHSYLTNDDAKAKDIIRRALLGALLGGGVGGLAGGALGGAAWNQIPNIPGYMDKMLDTWENAQGWNNDTLE